MVPLLSLFLLLGATNEPLPKELDYRLSLARALPAPYSAAVIVALLPSAKLTTRQIAGLAEEAYHLAGMDTAVALRAWLAYRDNFDKETEVPLAFPVRLESSRASCTAREVSDPKDYYRWALQAGPVEFATATKSARSAVDAGRMAEAILAAGSDQNIGLLLRLLANATGSDREFVEAMRFTGLHNSILKLAEQSNLQTARSILNGYRSFLTTNLAGQRCAGNRSEEFRGVFDDFNKLALKLRGVALIPEEAAVVRSVETTTREIMPNPFALTYKVAQAPVDETSLRSMLTEISQYRLEQKPGTNETTEEAKSFLYGTLARRLETSPLQGMVIEQWLRFVASSRLRDENPKIWFRSARTFYEWARGYRMRQAAIESAGDPALTAYIKLTTLLPESEVARVLP